MDELYEMFARANDRTGDHASDAGRFFDLCRRLKNEASPESLLAAEILEAVYVSWSCYVDPVNCE